MHGQYRGTVPSARESRDMHRNTCFRTTPVHGLDAVKEGPVHVVAAVTGADRVVCVKSS